MDSVLRTDVKCGAFQVVFVFLTQLPRFFTVWGLYIMMFGNYEPPWSCIVDAGLGDANSTRTPTGSRIGSNATSNPIRLEPNSHDLTETFASTDNGSSAYYKGSCDILPSCNRIEFDSDSSTIVTEFGLICDRSWIASLIISLELLAVVPGAYVGGQCGERFGRKKSLYGSTALLTSSVGLALLSTSWQIYTAFSILIGLGSGGILSTCNVYTLEFLDPWWRAMFTSIPVWNASIAVFALVIVWLRDWRLIHAASALLPAIALLGAFWVPESVRWLEVHGRRREAVKAVKKIYATNRQSFPLSQEAIDEEIAREVSNEIESSRGRVSTAHKTYLDLFRDPYVRSITWRAAVAWLCILIAYLAMGYGVKSLAGDYYVNVIIASTSEVPMMLTIGPMSNKLGRRWSAMSFLCLAAVTCGAIVLVQVLAESESRGFPTKVLALVAKASAAAAWATLATMCVELFPTVVRNLGYGFLTLVSRSGGIVAPYLIPQDPSWFAICFSVMTVFLGISVALTMSLPETKDRPLVDEIPHRGDVESSRLGGEVGDDVEEGKDGVDDDGSVIGESSENGKDKEVNGGKLILKNKLNV